MILKEEYEEADGGQVGFGVGLAVLLVLTAIFAAGRLDPAEASRAMSWNVALAGSGMPMIFCAAGLIKCRRTIRAWRDQKRLRMIQDEVCRDVE